ncbi:hypothetical protein ACIBG5_10935 [Kribbella sp. NPDC050241]|uniref:hypothetical protein n=1 Tax=Kribbella sp. NPDC050241 TaxID=3364115 RepID=UPI0037945904
MTLPQLFHDGVLATGAATLLYTTTITLATITALAAPNPDQRRNARQVLALLLRRRSTN